MNNSPQKTRIIPVIGLVGGIGSGKSFLARAGAAGLPMEVIDADQIAHQVLTRPDVKKRLSEAFGNSIFSPSGDVLRREVGQLVFGPTDAHTQLRKQLEAIVHPQIRQEILTQISQLRQRPDLRGIVLDAAVMLETGWKDFCQAIIFIDVPEAERMRRVISARNWTRDEFFARESQQRPLEYKQSVAGYCVNNSAADPAAIQQIQQIFSKIMDEFAS